MLGNYVLGFHSVGPCASCSQFAKDTFANIPRTVFIPHMLEEFRVGVSKCMYRVRNSQTKR